MHTFIHHYNSERYQWILKKMTPDEYRSHLLTA
ncbi:IS3 family transposase [Brevibacillus sp. SYSU BS000544]